MKNIKELQSMGFDSGIKIAKMMIDEDECGTKELKKEEMIAGPRLFHD